jgi:predicted metal-dependent hydrolase
MSRFQPTPTPADCEGEIHPEALRGFELFNAGKYWHAHEALETAWLEETGQIRYLYQGILQIGVTYYHIQRGNFRGAVKVYKRAQRWIQPFPEICRGIDVAGLRRDSARVMDAVQDLGPDHLTELDLQLLKPVRWDGDAG